MFNRFRQTLSGGEEGHVASVLGSLIAAVGAIVLAIGAAGDSDGTIWAGAIVMAVAFLGGAIISHRMVDYPVYDRLWNLEKDD